MRGLSDISGLVARFFAATGKHELHGASGVQFYYGVPLSCFVMAVIFLTRSGRELGWAIVPHEAVEVEWSYSALLQGSPLEDLLR